MCTGKDKTASNKKLTSESWHLRHVKRAKGLVDFHQGAGLFNECARLGRARELRARESLRLKGSEKVFAILGRSRRLSISFRHIIRPRPPSTFLLTSCIRFSLRTYRKFDGGQMDDRNLQKKSTSKRRYSYHCSKFNILPVSCWFTISFGTLLKRSLRLWKLDNADSSAPFAKAVVFGCKCAKYLESKLVYLKEMKIYLHSATILYIPTTIASTSSWMKSPKTKRKTVWDAWTRSNKKYTVQGQALRVSDMVHWNMTGIEASVAF